MRSFATHMLLKCLPISLIGSTEVLGGGFMPYPAADNTGGRPDGERGTGASGDGPRPSQGGGPPLDSAVMAATILANTIRARRINAAPVRMSCPRSKYPTATSRVPIDASLIAIRMLIWCLDVKAA